MIFLMKTPEELIREDAARQALEAAAKKIEEQICAHAYMAAFKKAAKIIRQLKPL